MVEELQPKVGKPQSPQSSQMRGSFGQYNKKLEDVIFLQNFVLVNPRP